MLVFVRDLCYDSHGMVLLVTNHSLLAVVLDAFVHNNGITAGHIADKNIHCC